MQTHAQVKIELTGEIAPTQLCDVQNMARKSTIESPTTNPQYDTSQPTNVANLTTGR